MWADNRDRVNQSEHAKCIIRGWEFNKGEYSLLVYTKTVDSVERGRWLARQTPNILCYLPPRTREKMASRFASVTSEENIQINFFVLYIISLF